MTTQLEKMLLVEAKDKGMQLKHLLVATITLR
jgi:hypothetical protein